MTENNITFILGSIILVVLVTYWLIPQVWRRFLILISSLAVLFSVNSTNAFLIIGHITFIYLITSNLPRLSPTLKSIVFRLAVVWLVGSLVLVKIMIGASWESPTVVFLGLSYMTFRLIHYSVLAYKGEIKNEGLLGYFDLVSHVLFFPSLIAGPVLYYESWIEQRPPSQVNFKEINLGLLRILSGVFKKFLLSDQLNAFLIIPVLKAPSDFSGWILAAVVCADFIRIYLDFSGYSDVAIGTARIFGYRLPENFNFPLLRSNIADFWRSWHITLHDFIRDHIFFPFFVYRSTPIKVYAGLFFTMCLMMIWHAFSWGFLILGILNGFAMVIWHWVQNVKRRNERVSLFLNTRPATFFCTLLTFIFSSFSAVFGFRGVDTALALYSRIFNF